MQWEKDKTYQIPLQRRASDSERTGTDHVMTILRSVRHMRENLADNHSLHILAASALLSPYHFHRVFRQVTRCTPHRFLTAWRMEEAKRLLANQRTNVTDVCMQVGYTSVGTFTTQFTRMVGIPPTRFRQLMRQFGETSFGEAWVLAGCHTPDRAAAQVIGHVTADPDCGVLAVVGMFSSKLPQGPPAACAMVRVPGDAVFLDLPAGDYYPLTMSFPVTATVREAMRSDAACIGESTGAVHITDGHPSRQRSFSVRVRRRLPIDPPLVLAVPLLLAVSRADVTF